MGGSIFLKSEFGKGSKFSFDLPILSPISENKERNSIISRKDRVNISLNI